MKSSVVFGMFFLLLQIISRDAAAAESMYMVDEGLKSMAESIIADYREQRSVCAQALDSERADCYYRLRIKLWDYQEARKILADLQVQRSATTLAAQ